MKILRMLSLKCGECRRGWCASETAKIERCLFCGAAAKLVRVTGRF